MGNRLHSSPGCSPRFRDPFNCFFDELTSDDLYELDQVRKQLEEHYHNRYKMLQNELDETLAEKFNALGTEEFKARYGNQPSYDTPQMEYFICVDELIQQYILDGGNATYDELREKFDNECESANIFL